jgi:ribosomal-protein-alanine N-acetyltransferase
MFELWSQPEVCKHSGPAVDSSGRAIELPARAPSESDRLLEYWLDRARAGTGFRWAVVLQDRAEFVGAVGFNALGACCEYAYHLVPRFWGAGLASEASRIAADWAFSHGAESVEAFVEPANPRSVRLVERLGYRRIHQRPEGLTRYILTRERARPESR